MGLFARKHVEEPLPVDPKHALVDELYKSFPYGRSPFGVRSLIQMIVWTLLEMKKRGLI